MGAFLLPFKDFVGVKLQFGQRLDKKFTFLARITSFLAKNRVKLIKSSVLEENFRYF
jgi:hypothetical protein